MKKQRGVFEKEPGSGVWWVQYFDSDGRRRREKIGSKSDAIKAVKLRRADAIRGVKLPDNLRAKAMSFKELAEEALIWSRAHKKSAIDDERRMKELIAKFGDCAAEQISAGDINVWLDSQAARWTLCTRNRYIALLNMVYRVALDHGRIKINPVQMVKQKLEHNECIVEITAEQEARLREVISEIVQ